MRRARGQSISRDGERSRAVERLPRAWRFCRHALQRRPDQEFEPERPGRLEKEGRIWTRDDGADGGGLRSDEEMKKP